MPETPATPSPNFTDVEKAREAGRKGGLRKAELARLRKDDPEAFMRETFAAKRAELSEELLDAALGRNAWDGLPLEKRLTALFKAMEYAVGRPTPRKDAAQEEETPEQGLVIE